MKPSILRNLLISFLGFGLLMGLVFPLYAQFFVEWIPGMQLWFSIGCIIAGLSIGVVNYWLCKWVLLRRLQRISDVAQAISNNDITQECTIKSHDLIGEIIDSFNQMANNLRSMISHISNSSSELDSKITQLSDIAENSQQTASRQQEETGHVVHAINEISSSTQQIAEMAREAADSSSQVNKNAQEGALIATEAIGSISSLITNMDETGRVISQLEENSANIGMVLDVIRGIAEQTNLLALNAAIEAARAGEQGRGFAVVADEVRTLATRTQESTEEIEKMISLLQEGSKSAVKVMESSQHQAVDTEERFERAAELLAEISGSVASLSQISSHFSAAANSQETQVETVRGHIDQINSACQATAENADMAVASSNGLRTQADELNDMLGKFKY